MEVACEGRDFVDAFDYLFTVRAMFQLEDLVIFFAEKHIEDVGEGILKVLRELRLLLRKRSAPSKQRKPDDRSIPHGSRYEYPGWSRVGDQPVS